MNDMDFSAIISFHNDVINMSYTDLVERIGEPTSFGSGDDKTQVEWWLVTDDGVEFSIYDWKEYYRDVKNGENVEWHVGRNTKLGSLESITKYLSDKNVKIEDYR